jgi:hypothetical protein
MPRLPPADSAKPAGRARDGRYRCRRRAIVCKLSGNQLMPLRWAVWRCASQDRWSDQELQLSGN